MSITSKFWIFASILFIFACSQSGRRGSNSKKNNTNSQNESFSPRIRNGKIIVKMQKVNGVFQIPVEVNGIKMFFIFDTGASIISISQTEANFLWKQGKLSTEDIKGTVNFTDANGDISEGTIIILTTIKIGNRILNEVEASVVHNLNAPLLLGQSAMAKFGKISIDNNREEITFE